MPLADSILALSPWLYWKLDEASGATTIVDYGSGGHNGTVSGDLALGVVGPELATTAARLFVTGLIKTAALGITTFTNTTVMAMVTIPPTIPTPSRVPFFGLGDPANAQNRGWVYQNEVQSVNTARFRWGTQSAQNTASAPYPGNNWHNIVGWLTPSPQSQGIYIDGQPSGTGGNLGAAPLSTDYMYLTSAWPIVISHVAVFQRVLTQTEIQTVSNQVKAWPYETPINVPYPATASEPVDLTPVLEQTTQILENQAITDPIVVTTIPAINTTTTAIDAKTSTIQGQTTTIQTDTQNMVNTLFPQLETVINDIGLTINDIQNAVRGTITDGFTSVVRTVGELLSTRSTDELAEVPGSAESCLPIAIELDGQRVYGIRLEITSYPDTWEFRTPDHAWSLKDLAVIRLYHGSHLLERRGVHTIVYTWQPIPQASLPWLGNIVPLQPSGVTLTVDFATGVCGQLVLLNESS